MNLIISNSSGRPIYEQITAQIKNSIISGELQEGEALPSMRALAKDMNSAFGGRGGGKPEMVQGTINGTENEMREWIRKKAEEENHESNA